MTRATLLHVLERPTALGPGEVRELEQLAQAFPYCQTAHLLLAKAAHDHGTMLAGQRLRRAATYAADRALLRRLIEQVEPAPLPEVTPAPEAAPATPAVAVAPESDVVIASFQAAAPVAEPKPAVQEAPEPTEAQAPELAAEPACIEPIVEPVLEPEVAADVPAAAPPALPASTGEAETPAAEALTSVEPDESVLLDKEGAEIPAVAPPVFAAEVAIVDSEPASVASDAAPEADLPAQAPAIRPPAEVGDARFEFGLAEPPAPAAPTYELPGLVDEWAASAVTRSLGSREPLNEILNLPAAASEPEPVLTPAAFTGDDVIGYGFGESSRLGFSMQLLHLLTDQAEAAECTSAQAAAAQPPAAPLPPADTFFEPDPLLLQHWAAHCPPVPALPTSLDLINNFLRRQPRLTRPAMLPPSPATQADLSVRSTRAEPDLVSESLARILVRQGKTIRAIEVYEKLMVKHPEKAEQFAAEIRQLQLPG